MFDSFFGQDTVEIDNRLFEKMSKASKPTLAGSSGTFVFSGSARDILDPGRF